MQIEVTGLENLQAKLKDLQSKVENTQPLMVRLANHLYNIADESFEKEKSPNNISWDPIKPRKDDNHPDKILRDSDQMYDSLEYHATNDTAIVGLNAVNNGFDYALTHQFGTDKAGRSKDVTIEARPFLPIDENGKLYDGVEEELIEILDDYVKEVLK